MTALILHNRDVSQYVVVNAEGRRFGPTDFQTLELWATQGRIGPDMMVEDLLSGTTMTAAAVPGLSEVLSSGESYYRAQPETSKGDRRATTAFVLGLISVVAWCIPLAGFAVGLGAVICGATSLRSERFAFALLGTILGSLCLLLSIANAILSAIWMANGGFNGF